VDYLDADDKPEKAAVGMNLDHYFRSTLRKNLVHFFDEEVWTFV